MTNYIGAFLCVLFDDVQKDYSLQHRLQLSRILFGSRFSFHFHLPCGSPFWMARFLSRSLLRDSKTLIRDPIPPSFLQTNLRSRFVAVRRRSGRPGKSSPAAAHVEVVEIETGEITGSGGEVEVRLGMRRLEDAIHGIIVRRAAPGWLPFVPGSSYWVPPRGSSLGLVDLVGKLANPLTEDEAMSLTNARGWPSRAYFLEGSSPLPVKTRTRKIVHSDDEE